MRYALVDINKHNHKLPVRQGEYVRAASEAYVEIISSVISGYVRVKVQLGLSHNKVEVGEPVSGRPHLGVLAKK